MATFLNQLAVLLRAIWTAIVTVGRTAAEHFSEWLVMVYGWLKAYGDGVISWLLTMANNHMPSPAYSTFEGVLKQINFFIPLSETIALASVLLALWVMVYLYRVVKSWLWGTS
jgi:hypothetical protein